MLSNHLTLSHPLFLLPSIFPSIGVFSNELALPIRWPTYWSLSFSISLSNKYSGLISFKTDWFDLAVQGTVKSLLHHHNSKASILQTSAFFMVQFSHYKWLLGKNIALTMQTFWKLLSLLFNMLSRFVIAFLSRSNHLLISWLQSLSAVILETKKRKSVTASKFSPSVCHEVMGLDPMTLVFWMFKLIFSSTLFHPQEALNSSSLSAVRVVSSAHPKLLIFLLAILISDCDSSSLVFCLMYCV